MVEADERGLEAELLTEFDHLPGELADALWFCDMTTGPDGTSVDVADRLAEIGSRYGPEHVVTRSIERAGHQIRAAAGRTEERLGARRAGY
jgi:hypothetical protein